MIMAMMMIMITIISENLSWVCVGGREGFALGAVSFCNHNGPLIKIIKGIGPSRSATWRCRDVGVGGATSPAMSQGLQGHRQRRRH